MEDPVNESEMLRLIAEFNKDRSAASIVTISLVIPSSSSGSVRLLESEMGREIVSFPVQRIRFCARGPPLSVDAECFALSFTQLSVPTDKGAQRKVLHQCHIFRSQVAEAAGKALLCFSNTFRSSNRSSSIDLPIHSCPSTPCSSRDDRLGPDFANLYPKTGTEESYEFEAFLEIKEWDEASKAYAICPVERNCFKMRRDRPRRVSMVLSQKRGPRPLPVRSCFGLLLAPGRNLRHPDMHLLDMVSSGVGQANPLMYMAEATWDPRGRNFEVLNTETPKGMRSLFHLSAYLRRSV